MIVILGLNPVWQKVLTFNRFDQGQVNRASSLVSFASGKGINMSRALNQLDVPNQIIQPLGGTTGRQFVENARSFANLFSIPIAASTRSCTTCLDGEGGATEIIEPSPCLSSEENQQLLTLIENRIADATAIIIAGTIPEGIDLEALSLILKDREVLLDNFQQLEPLLKNGVGSSLKINAGELRQLVGVAGIEGIKILLNSYPQLNHIAITDEANPSYLFTDSRFYEIKIEECWSMVNPIGAGDTSSATWTHYLSQNIPVLDALIKSLAAARASCLSKIPGQFSLPIAVEIEQKITYRLLEA